MEHKLFIANLPDGITEDQLQEVCAAHGEVTFLSLLHDENTGAFTGTARVTLETDEALEPILAALNAHWFDDRRMAVSPAEKVGPWQKLTDEQREFSREIARKLNERLPLAKGQISRLLQACGEAFVQGIFEDTLRVEEAGGIWLPDFNRRRTPGGVFLYLARQSVSPELRQVVFVRPTKRQQIQAKRAKAARKAAAAAPSTPDEAQASSVTPAEPTSRDVEPPAPDVVKPPAQVAAATVSEPAETQEPVEPVAADTPSMQDQLAELRRAYQAANEQLVAVKSGQAKVSPMVAMKEFVDAKRALDDFLRQHPELGQGDTG